MDDRDEKELQLVEVQTPSEIPGRIIDWHLVLAGFIPVRHGSSAWSPVECPILTLGILEEFGITAETLRWPTPSFHLLLSIQRSHYWFTLTGSVFLVLHSTNSDFQVVHQTQSVMRGSCTLREIRYAGDKDRSQFIPKKKKERFQVLHMADS